MPQQRKLTKIPRTRFKKPDLVDKMFTARLFWYYWSKNAKDYTYGNVQFKNTKSAPSDHSVYLICYCYIKIFTIKCQITLYQALGQITMHYQKDVDIHWRKFKLNFLKYDFGALKIKVISRCRLISFPLW